MSGYGRVENFKSDDHYTPKWLFDGLGLTFNVDVCAPTEGVPWIPAKTHFDIEADGLAQEWKGLVWMNPPYSKPTPWVDKFIEHGNGVALLPSTRGKWWYKIWEAADIVMPTPYNFKFERPDGHAKVIMFQTMLFGIGEEAKEAISQLEMHRYR